MARRLAAIFLVLGSVVPGFGQIVEIIDSSGDGAGNPFNGPQESSIAVDAAGNTYLTGADSDNAFKIPPAGVIEEIIDGTGDGAGNGLNRPHAIAVDASGNVYVTGVSSDNAFKITPAGVIEEIIDRTGTALETRSTFPMASPSTPRETSMSRELPPTTRSSSPLLLPSRPESLPGRWWSRTCCRSAAPTPTSPSRSRA